VISTANREKTVIVEIPKVIRDGAERLFQFLGRRSGADPLVLGDQGKGLDAKLVVERLALLVNQTHIAFGPPRPGISWSNEPVKISARG